MLHHRREELDDDDDRIVEFAEAPALPATMWLELKKWHVGTAAPSTARTFGVAVIRRQFPSINSPSARNASPVASRTPATPRRDGTPVIAHITFPGSTSS